MSSPRQPYNSLVTVCILASLVALTPNASIAIPPLGLTQVASEPDNDAEILIVGDDAYISGSRDIWILDASANVDVLRVSHPELGIFGNPSRVVIGPDSRPYAGATFFRNDAMSFEEWRDRIVYVPF